MNASFKPQNPKFSHCENNLKNMTDYSAGAASGPGEIKYLSVARVNEALLLLTVPSANTKKAYSDEVGLALPTIFHFSTRRRRSR